MTVPKARVRDFVYVALTGMILFGGTVQAQSIPPPQQLDMNFWFRAIMSGLLGTLIWIAKGSDTRLKNAEKRIQEFDQINATRTEKIEHQDKRLTNLEHEQKQHATLISMQRELLLTKYHDKEDTERHREHVENTLLQISQRMMRIEERMRLGAPNDEPRG